MRRTRYANHAHERQTHLSICLRPKIGAGERVHGEFLLSSGLGGHRGRSRCSVPTSSRKYPRLLASVAELDHSGMQLTDDQIAELRTVLEKDFGRTFTDTEALDAFRRFELLYRAVCKGYRTPKPIDDQAVRGSTTSGS